MTQLPSKYHGKYLGKYGIYGINKYWCDTCHSEEQQNHPHFNSMQSITSTLAGDLVVSCAVPDSNINVLTKKESLKYKNSILNEREKTHGSFDKVAQFVQDLKAAIRDASDNKGIQTINDVQAEALDCIAMKLARIVHGNADEIDHWKDIAGYAELVVASLENMKKEKDKENSI